MRQLAVLIPTLLEGSGGHKTIIDNCSELARQGVEIVFHLEDLSGRKTDLSEQSELFWSLTDHWNTMPEMRVGWEDASAGAEAILATVGQSAHLAAQSSAKDKFYFVQDRESQFNPVSSAYYKIESSYQLPLKKIVIGNWLRKMLHSEFGQPAISIPFGVDFDTYFNRRLKLIGRPVVAAVMQPEKARRLSDFVLEAAALVQRSRPEVQFLAFGSNAQISTPNNMRNLGILGEKSLANIYAVSDLGICLSGTNPSRIPFEMGACGLDVVDIDSDNTAHDYGEWVSRVSPSPEGVAQHVILAIDRLEHREQDSIRKSDIDIAARSEERKSFARAILNWEEILVNDSRGYFERLPSQTHGTERHKDASR